MQSGSESDPADRTMAARCVVPRSSNATIVAGGVIQRARKQGTEGDPDDPGGPGGVGHKLATTILLRPLGANTRELKISMVNRSIFLLGMGLTAMDLPMDL